MRTRMQLSPRVRPSVKLKTTIVYVTAGVAMVSIIGVLVFFYLNFGNSEKTYAAITYYSSNASGNWTTSATWTGGTTPATADLSSSNITIKSNHTVTRTGSISGTNDNTLTIQVNGKLTINGDFEVKNNFVLNNYGTLVITGNLIGKNGATITVNGGGTMSVGGDVDFDNNTTITVNGNLTVGGTISTGANSTFNGSGTVRVDGTSGCGSWSGRSGGCTAGPVILPVELLSFTAKDNGNGSVTLNWATATEKNNDYFTIQRSSDGINYTKITQVKGNGTTKNISRYEFVDQQPDQERLYYRLSQTDFDETTEVFSPVFVEVTLDVSELSAYPNPLLGRQLTISLPTAERGVISIVDYKGNAILNKEADGVDTVVEVEFDRDLPAGLYYINYKTSSSVKTTKIVKK